MTSTREPRRVARARDGGGDGGRGRGRDEQGGLALFGDLMEELGFMWVVRSCRGGGGRAGPMWPCKRLHIDCFRFALVSQWACFKDDCQCLMQVHHNCTLVFPIVSQG